MQWCSGLLRLFGWGKLPLRLSQNLHVLWTRYGSIRNSFFNLINHSCVQKSILSVLDVTRNRMKACRKQKGGYIQIPYVLTGENGKKKRDLVLSNRQDKIDSQRSIFGWDQSRIRGHAARRLLYPYHWLRGLFSHSCWSLRMTQPGCLYYDVIQDSHYLVKYLTKDEITPVSNITVTFSLAVMPLRVTHRNIYLWNWVGKDLNVQRDVCDRKCISIYTTNH